RRVQLAHLATRHAIPAIYPVRDFADVGGLMSYGPSLNDAYRHVGGYVGPGIPTPKAATHSERRAEALKRFLSKKYGIDASNLVTVGYGKTQLKNAAGPFASENRRVQVINASDK